MASFVLVHGAWHGGWCWHKIVARLEKAGHTVVAPDMPAHGTDRTPVETLTLAMIAGRISDVVAAQKEPVILVGHSYGGTIITEVGERVTERIKRLVYLTAFVVPGGKSTMEVNPPDDASLIGPNLVMAPDGLTVAMNSAVLRETFYADCSDDDVALARAMLVPEAVAPFSTPSTATAERWGRLPSAYIECTRDRAIGIGRQRELAGHLVGPKRVSLDCDHSPFFSRPDELTQALIALA
jgi:pimeloyl-ACP methyl ester carboxylesterase